MLTEVFYLHEKGSLADARLCTYILDDSDSIAIEKRPMMLICPGDGSMRKALPHKRCGEILSVYIITSNSRKGKQKN